MNAYVLVDAGYTGIGIPPRDVAKNVSSLLKKSRGRVKFQGLVLRTTDDRVDSDYPRIDLQVVADVVEDLSEKEVFIPCIIFENNGSILYEWDQVMMDLGHDIINDSTKIYSRCGMETYGFKNRDTEVPLKTCLTMKAQIRDIRKVRRGDFVGLGDGWEAPIDSFVAVVSGGYSDGYPRFLNGEQIQAFVRHEEESYNIVGEICLDHFLIHLGSSKQTPKVQIGNYVVLFGSSSQDSGCLEFTQLCNLAEVSPTQTLCHIAARVAIRWKSTGLTRRNTITRMNEGGKRKDSDEVEQDEKQKSQKKEKKKEKKDSKKKKRKKKKKKRRKHSNR